MTSRPSTAPPILAVLAIVLATLGAYVGGYLLRGRVFPVPIKVRARAFASYTERCLFWPAMYAEGFCTGLNIVSQYPEGGGTVTQLVYDAP